MVSSAKSPVAALETISRPCGLIFRQEPYLFSNKEMSLLGEESWRQWRLFVPTWKPCRGQSPLQRKSLRYYFDPVLCQCVPWFFVEFTHDGFSGYIFPRHRCGVPCTYYELLSCFRSLPYLLTVIPVLVISSGKDSNNLFFVRFVVCCFHSSQ